jgi:hypothetical protein
MSPAACVNWQLSVIKMGIGAADWTMKTQFGFLAVGLGIGTAIGWMMGSSSSSPVAPPMAAATKSERPAITSDASTVVGPDEKRATKRERPAAADKPDQPKVMTFSSSSGGEMTPEMKAIFAKMEEQRKEARTRRIDERLAALKSRLNLTPDQEAKVRALLENSPEMGLGGLPLMATKVSRDGKAGAVSIGAGHANGDNTNGANFEQQLAGLLSPEQQDEFTAFQQEQRENQVEIATNREMAQLQQQLTLTPEQKDQAFQALGDIARKEAENPQRGFDPAAIEAAKQARTDALRPILTPEQIKAYESNPAMSFGIPEVTVMPGGAEIRSIIAAPATDK